MAAPLDGGGTGIVAFGDNAPAEKRKAGRPKGSTKLKLTDELCKQIEGLGRIQCTMREAGAVLSVNEETFSDFLRRHKTAMEAWENGRERGKASLRRSQFRMAETNPTMQIWLGKQWLGQKDNMQLGGDPNQPLQHAVQVTFVRPDHSRGS